MTALLSLLHWMAWIIGTLLALGLIPAVWFIVAYTRYTRSLSREEQIEAANHMVRT